MTVTIRGIAAALLVATIAAVCVRLGFWQLDRLEQRRARNAAIESATLLPPLELSGPVVAAVARDPERYLYRRVRVAGQYDAEGEVLLRGRTHGGRPGVHLVTPLRLAGSDTAVLVNRGWAAAPDAATLDPSGYAEPGVRSVEGILQLVPDAPTDRAPLRMAVAGDSVLTLRRLDRELLRRHLGRPVLPLYVQQLPAPADGPAPRLARVPVPELTEGSHLSYAVQWFGFAAVAVIGFLVVVIRRTSG